MGLFRADRCLVVGEVAQAHDGSLGTAHAFIDAIARAGADAVKFQTHIAAAESTAAEPWRVRFSPQDKTRFDYWKRMEWSEEHWLGLRQHADEKGLAFVASPFSPEAVALLSRIGVAAWKVASGEVSNTPLLQALAATREPLVISSGMSDLAELDAAVAVARQAGSELAVLQCTSTYPCPPERVGLNLIPELRARHGCAVGLSDHSGTIYPGLAAVTLGIEVLEVHVCLSREAFGPDVASSLTTSELRQLVEGIRFIETMRSHPVAKDEVAAAMAPLRATFGKSVVARASLAAGTTLRSEHIALKKPGTGIPARELPRVLGRRLRHAVAADHLLRDEDLEP